MRGASAPAKIETAVSREAEIVKIFHTELRGRRPTPSEAQVARLVPWMDPLPISPALQAAVASLDGWQPLFPAWKIVRRAGFEAREAIRTMRSQMSDATWNQITEWNDGLAVLQQALERFGEQLDPEPPLRKERPGPKEKILQHKIARAIAEDIAAVMRAAGGGATVGLTGGDGPVARIGKTLIARHLRRHISPATFAEWVQKGMDGKT